MYLKITPIEIKKIIYSAKLQGPNLSQYQNIFIQIVTHLLHLFDEIEIRIQICLFHLSFYKMCCVKENQLLVNKAFVTHHSVLDV